jgi:hypothetical protein
MSVRLGFMIAAMNGLKVCAADIGNAFLYGKTREKVYIIAGREFGALQGKPLIIDGGLYGLRSSSARFHEHLSAKLRKMGYRPSKADPDFWMKKVDDHWEYIATYVDDILSFSKDPMAVIDELQKDYVLKGIGIPEYYLGGNIVELGDEWVKQGITHALSATTYVERVIGKYESVLGLTIVRKKTPMDDKYHPETDETEMLTPKEASLYRGLIGSANWMITLGRSDIYYAVNTLSRYSMAPRKGHIDAMIRVFGYLKQCPDAQVMIDPNPLKVETTQPLLTHDWTEFYPDAEEEIPHDIPEPLGRVASTVCFVDADHAHDLVTRRSVTGISVRN